MDPGNVESQYRPLADDVHQGRGAESVQRQLEAMYEAAREARIVVVAGTIIPFNVASADQNARMRAVNDWIRSYAAAHEVNVVFCDTRTAVAAPGSRIARCPPPTTCTRRLPATS
jgi:tryptophanase